MTGSRAPLPSREAPWPTLLGALADVQARIYTMTYEPEPGATELELATVEGELRYRLPEQYREFLTHVGGWRSMFEETHALGPHDLIAGDLHRRGLMLLSGIGDDVLAGAGITLRDLLPVAASTTATDLFAVIVRGPLAGGVLWSTGAQGAPMALFNDVRAWLVAMVDDAEDLYAAINEDPVAQSPDFLGIWAD